MSKVIISAIVFILVCETSNGQVPSPKREVRAVWIATVAGLDWPKSYDPVDQQRSLREMADKLHSAHFNTIFFQVRGRADAMYRSEYEPWAQQLTGTHGKDPGWDPLAFIIQESHDRGMEIHAWFNTFLVKNGNSRPPESQPRHVILSHPEWVHLVKGEWWIDPGIPEARNYTVDVALDLVRKYDIDGVHFDFIRYPGDQFPDQTTYQLYGTGQSRGDWRRDNVNKFVRLFYDEAVKIKPMLKVGSAPIGIYDRESGEIGLHSYDQLFQDSRRWLRDAKHDYLTPQVYWSLGRKPGNPDFGALARDWSRHSYGRHVYLGIAAYKQDVFHEIPELIDTSRFYGVTGNSFFRYEHISKMLDVGMRYRCLANVPPMRWKDSLPPNPPAGLKVTDDGDGIFQLEWRPPSNARDGDGAKLYDIYRSIQHPVNIDDPKNLIAIILSNTSLYTDTIRHPIAVKYFYAVTALDKGNNESLPTNEGAIVVPEIVQLSKRFSDELKLRQSYPEPASDFVYFSYALKGSSPVWIEILDGSNREVTRVVDAIQSQGEYVAGANISNLKEGVYTYQLIAGNTTMRRSMTVKR